MRKVLEFRQNADECRTLAARMKTEIARKELLEIASHWEKLAEARIELVRACPDRGNPPPGSLRPAVALPYGAMNPTWRPLSI